MKRLEDVIQDSTALKAHLVGQLKSLSNAVPELVNFGISLAQQLATVLSFAKQTAMSTVAKDLHLVGEAVSKAIAQLAGECSKLLPIALEPENVIKIRQSPARHPGLSVSENEYGLTAQLSLAGTPCNAFGTNITDLTIEVTHQSQTT
ncbi:hypothetical protein JVT61DRAFT_10756 [Boletus reticuloceps]|uniref:Uncharacterized protein n=1 Tax=Boletus reticuloceps TaxID=495285 RepID=A0A8I3A479_9AGAM|nr:hypothetical protein JVT61DRAFT_10756 [Boletus reticuloceps]